MTAANALTINDGVAEAVIAPELGAGLATYDLVGPSGRTHVFRPCHDPWRARPFDLALNLLVPVVQPHFRRRASISTASFHPLAPNLPGEPFPIHGNGFSSRMARRARDGGQRRPVASLRRPRPVPVRSARELLPRPRAPSPCGSPSAISRPSRCLSASASTPGSCGARATLLTARAGRVVMETHDHLPAGEAPARLPRRVGLRRPARAPVGLDQQRLPRLGRSRDRSVARPEPRA